MILKMYLRLMTFDWWDLCVFASERIYQMLVNTDHTSVGASAKLKSLLHSSMNTCKAEIYVLYWNTVTMGFSVSKVLLFKTFSFI